MLLGGRWDNPAKVPQIQVMELGFTGGCKALKNSPDQYGNMLGMGVISLGRVLG